MAQADYFTFSGKNKLSGTIDLTVAGWRASLSYEGKRADDVSIRSESLGLVVTAVFDGRAGSHTQQVMVVVPQVNVETAVEGFDGFAAIVTHQSSIGGPIVNKGPTATYSVATLSGTATKKRPPPPRPRLERCAVKLDVVGWDSLDATSQFIAVSDTRNVKATSEPFKIFLATANLDEDLAQSEVEAYVESALLEVGNLADTEAQQKAKTALANLVTLLAGERWTQEPASAEPPWWSLEFTRTTLP